MHIFRWPAIAGLFFLLAIAVSGPAGAEPTDEREYSDEDALAHSQAVIGKEVSGVELIGKDGAAISLEQYRGKPLVISMIFTSCHHICPSTTQFLNQVVLKARNALDTDSFNVITVGFDTARDNPQRMGEFRRSTGVTDERWDFLAIDEANLDSLVEQLGFLYSPSPRGFDHLVQASIIDADGRVYRQVYGMQFPTPTMIEPLKELVFGTPRSESNLDYLGKRIRLFCTVYDPATDTYHVDISVFIGTFVGIVVSLLFGRVLIKEWRRSIKADQ
jgi:protein SCO1